MKFAAGTLIGAALFAGLATDTAAGEATEADEAGVRQAIENYITGWRDGDNTLLGETFATEHGYVIWLNGEGDDAVINSMTLGELSTGHRPYAGYGEPYRIRYLDVIGGELAFAKVEIAAQGGGSYVDALLLQKEGGHWRIVTKTFVFRPDMPVTAD